MNNRLLFVISAFLLLAGALLAASCTPISEPAAPVQPAQPTAAVVTLAARPAVGMPNPASAYCEQNGGKLEIR